MAEYWRFADRMAPGQVPVKRLRTEFDEFFFSREMRADELVPPGAAYYPREEPRYDDRDGRISWREPESLGMGHGSGLTGADIPGLVSGHHLGLGGQGAPNIGMSSHDDLSLLGQGGGRMLSMDSGMVKPSTMGINGGRPDYLPRQDSQVPRTGGPGLLPPDASPTLFVEGLPSDCSRREAAHVFRPFLGFKEVRLVRKDVKRPGGDPLVLCFVDFSDARYAATALEALQGYKFDETNRDSDSLRLQFARTPGPRGGGREDFRGGRDRDDFPRGGGRPFRR